MAWRSLYKFVFVTAFVTKLLAQKPPRSSYKYSDNVNSFWKKMAGYGAAERVLVIGVDGLGSYYLTDELGGPPVDVQTPNMDFLRETGASTYMTRSVIPPTSYPNWAGTVMGVGPEETGILTNGWNPTQEDCVFPFEYQNTTYTTCAGAAGNFWCSLTPVYEGVYRDCTYDECQFPWVYQGQVYNECITNGNGVTPWCSMDTQYQGRWLHCVDEWDMVTGRSTYFPTIFQAIKEQNPTLRTAMYTTWEVWHKSWPEGLVDFEYYEQPTYHPSALGRRFINDIILSPDVPEFMMIYFEDLDAVGHSSGWGSDAYYNMVTAVDAQIGQILSALQQVDKLESTLILLVSDHGGVGQGHGNIDVPTMYTPTILRGPGIRENFRIPCPTIGYPCYQGPGALNVRNFDIPGTALFSLGIQQPDLWISRPIFEAFGLDTETHNQADMYNHPQYESWDKLHGFKSAEHVLILGLDGLGSYYLSNATGGSVPPNVTPYMDALRATGASTFHARSVMPTVSFPNWAGTVMGSGPEEHGILSNSWVPGSEWEPSVGYNQFFPTIFQAVKEQDPSMRTAMYTTWEEWHMSWPQDLIDLEFYEPPRYNPNILTTRFIEEVLSAEDIPEMMMLYWEDVDYYAHQNGWGSDGYYDAVRENDLQIGRLLNALDDAQIRDSTTIIVVSDHGGVAYGHGTNEQPIQYTPLIVNGPGVKRGFSIPCPTRGYDCYKADGLNVRNFDAPSTALFALGLHQPNLWVGRPIHEVFANIFGD